MSEPRRLRDDGSSHPELGRLLRAARAPQALDTATFERSRRRVTALGAVPAALGVLVWIKHAALGLGAVLGVTVAAAATSPRWLAPREEVAAPPASAVVRKGAPVRVLPPPAPPSSLPEPAPIPETTSGSAPAPASAPSADGGLSRELALLERARSELERRPGSALVLLAQHEREFPHGALSLEREFLEISALVRFGRRAEAEARAAALKARSPGSLYERRLDAIFGDAGAP
jgi:hypothetical protein